MKLFVAFQNLTDHHFSPQTENCEDQNRDDDGGDLCVGPAGAAITVTDAALIESEFFPTPQGAGIAV
eukprot:CAMPEP_0114542818 /NCGR_PEP_ID=MMETSP0114-20121206/2030_1 /TAXON_ID=31324 /ORGANISM="Goniomonas sp, Strain m" /LENGTH=66 /DNA_ID=CAMNT_0001727125 /DNA_START=453 /DNA_END=649 /DNA_ORIENTATION=-